MLIAMELRNMDFGQDIAFHDQRVEPLQGDLSCFGDCGHFAIALAFFI